MTRLPCTCAAAACPLGCILPAVLRNNRLGQFMDTRQEVDHTPCNHADRGNKGSLMLAMTPLEQTSPPWPVSCHAVHGWVLLFRHILLWEGFFALHRLHRLCNSFSNKLKGMLTVRRPSSVPARKTRTAISPLFAHRIFLKGVFSAASTCMQACSMSQAARVLFSYYPLLDCGPSCLKKGTKCSTR